MDVKLRGRPVWTLNPVRYIRYRVARRRVERFRPVFEASPDNPRIRSVFIGLIVREGMIRMRTVLDRLAESERDDDRGC